MKATKQLQHMVLYAVNGTWFTIPRHSTLHSEDTGYAMRFSHCDARYKPRTRDKHPPTCLLAARRVHCNSFLAACRLAANENKARPDNTAVDTPTRLESPTATAVISVEPLLECLGYDSSTPLPVASIGPTSRSCLVKTRPAKNVSTNAIEQTKAKLSLIHI